jgi:hypothetical protein
MCGCHWSTPRGRWHTTPKVIHTFSFRADVRKATLSPLFSVASFLLSCFNIALRDGFTIPKILQRGDAAPTTRVPSTGIEVLDPSQSVEEEQLPFYDRNDYPMRIGALIKDRYQVVNKLGYGTSSIVWLCDDLKYVLLPSNFDYP